MKNNNKNQRKNIMDMQKTRNNCPYCNNSFKTLEVFFIHLISAHDYPMCIDIKYVEKDFKDRGFCLNHPGKYII